MNKYRFDASKNAYVCTECGEILIKDFWGNYECPNDCVKDISWGLIEDQPDSFDKEKYYKKRFGSC